MTNTEQKKTENQLIAHDLLASMGQLASGVAHELNNPLMSVIGFSDLLLHRNLSDDILVDLKIVNGEAQRAALIVKHLLTFASLQPQEKRSLTMNDTIKAVLTTRLNEQSVNDIQVFTRFEPNLPKILGNKAQLHQVFLNIIVNAEQAMHEAHRRGNLTITTERIGDYVRASFSDDGPGIPESHMSRMFTPFFTTRA